MVVVWVWCLCSAPPENIMHKMVNEVSPVRQPVESPALPPPPPGPRPPPGLLVSAESLPPNKFLNNCASKLRLKSGHQVENIGPFLYT